MPYKIKRQGTSFQVVSPDGKVVGSHPTRKKARQHQKALYANADKFYNPAENRTPGGPGSGGTGGRFAPGQVTPGRQSGGGGAGGAGGAAQQAPTGQQAAQQNQPPNSWMIQHQIPNADDRGGGGGISEGKENQIRAAATKDLAQAKEIEDQIKILRAQMVWDRQMVAFLNGTGPSPGQSPRSGGNTTGAAGNVGSGAAAGATSGAAAQRFSNTPQNNASYIQFLQQDAATLHNQIHQMENQAAALFDRGHDLLASIAGKTIVPEITITAGALVSLINNYMEEQDNWMLNLLCIILK